MLDEHPKGIINIVDATNIERNLYLTMQLMELDIPMVLALNMMDEVRENGGSVLVNQMEEMLGIPVIPIQQPRMRELMSWFSMHFMWQNIRKSRRSSIFAMLMKMAEQYIDASMRSCI
mgnify:CR=1 FL=1